MHGVNIKTGKRLSGDAHLKQSVIDILTTPKNTRVLLRDYGSDLPELVDSPQDQSSRVRIIAATSSALAKWEPRLKLNRIGVSRSGDGDYEITIEGINTETSTPLTLDGIKIYGNKS